jgi:hypothetical protein
LKNLFRYTYKSQIDIDVPSQKVWNIILDTSSYADWNPFTTKILTSWQIGEEVFMTFKLKPHGKPMLYSMQLEELTPKKAITWGRKMWHVQVRRRQTIEKLSDSQCHYTTAQIITGILSPLAHLLLGKDLKNSFNDLTRALKDYAEMRRD